MDSGAVAAALSNHEIAGWGQEKQLRLGERPLLGSILVASSSPPAFSSDDEDERSGSSLCSSTTSTFLSDSEEEQEEEADSPVGLSTNSPLSKMSDLMAQLPIKRGLSCHYNGKSRSYVSLASVTSVDDLPKPERGPARKKLKSCRSYGGGMADCVDRGGCPNTINLCCPPPLPFPVPAPAKLAAAAANNKIELGSSSSSLQCPPPMMGAERSDGFLRSSWRPPPVPLREHRPGRFPATHPQALLFA